MRFVWDERKRELNVKKYGLDFVDAKLAFNDPHAWFDIDERYSDERWVLIGKLKNKLIVVVAYTEPDIETIRIISMRRAVRKEIRQYEKHKELTYERS